MPIKTVKFRKRKHTKSTWITTGIMNSIKYRDNLYMLLKHADPNSANYLNLKTNLRTYNNILKNNIRNAKQLYFSLIFNQCKNDVKKTWNAINSIISKSAKNAPKTIRLRIGNEFISNNEQVANTFNTFFTEIEATLANSIKVIDGENYNQYLGDRYNAIFKFRPYTTMIY